GGKIAQRQMNREVAVALYDFEGSYLNVADLNGLAQGRAQFRGQTRIVLDALRAARLLLGTVLARRRVLEIFKRLGRLAAVVEQPSDEPGGKETVRDQEHEQDRSEHAAFGDVAALAEVVGSGRAIGRGLGGAAIGDVPRRRLVGRRPLVQLALR